MKIKLANKEKCLLQTSFALACIVPISAGLIGAVYGTQLLAISARSPDLESHFRYLSGLLLGLGLCFAFIIPNIERRCCEVRVLTFLVLIGGLARLCSISASGTPALPMNLALVMELIITPSLALWQARIARRYSIIQSRLDLTQFDGR